MNIRLLRTEWRASELANWDGPEAERCRLRKRSVSLTSGKHVCIVLFNKLLIAEGCLCGVADGHS